MTKIIPILKKIIHWLAVGCAVIFGLMFLMLLTAHAAVPSDYPVLESQFGKLNKRLSGPDRVENF